MKRQAPPPVLDYAHVLAYAIVGPGLRATGRPLLLVGGRPVDAVARFAICRNLYGESKSVLLFHTPQWNVIAVVLAPSVREAKRLAERWYEGLSRCWQKTNTTRSAARRWLVARSAGVACTLCGKLPPQVEGMFSKRGSNVCFDCVGKLHAALPSEESHAA